MSICDAIPEISCARAEVSCVIRDFASWLTQNGQVFPAPDKATFYSQFNQWLSDPVVAAGFIPFKYFDGQRAEDLTYLAIAWQLQFRRGNFEVKATSDPCYEELLNFESKFNSLNVAGVNKGWITTSPLDGTFVTAEFAEQFKIGAIRGAGLSVFMAFCVLLVSTWNWVVATIALIGILCVVSCVTGTMFLLGWKVGVLESIQLALVVGFSVDYIVHFANAYVEAREQKRAARTARALFDMGVSVVGGAATTIGASVFLMLTQMLFFARFGSFIFMTIGYSTVFAFFYFIGACFMFGPEENFGSIWCCKKKKRAISI